jgi:type VI secretion system protein ImpM
LNEQSHSPGLFGKIPAQAGFAHRRLPPDFIHAWDNWLQASLRTSQRVLGDAWLDIYLSSNIWRFVLQANACVEAAWAGVMMPSVDSAGHYFPLTLAAPIHASMADKKLFVQAVEWFDQLERLAIFSLSDEADLDHLDDLLLGLPPLKGGARSFLSRFYARSRTGQTLWQATAGGQNALVDKVFPGLPTPEDFVSLLTRHLPPKHTADSTPPQTPTDVHTETICVEKRARSDAGAAGLQWRSWALTDVGMRRKVNEDAFLNQPETGLWVVADGMGGHSAGDVASRTVVDKLGQIPPAASLVALEKATRKTLHKVNTELLDLAAEMGPGYVIGATVVTMLAAGDACVALWAGDSRLYRHRNGRLQQLTTDHSMAVEMAKVSHAAPNGYGENIVTRALGADPLLELDRIAFQALPGDHYLLCSDGLTKEVRPSEIEQILGAEGGRKGIRTLIALALERQASDNVTIVVVHAAPS